VLCRTLGNGTIQLFVDIYTAVGKPILEDYTDDVHNMTVEQALEWALDCGVSVGNGQKSERINVDPG
jgi:hypothetical protein